MKNVVALCLSLALTTPAKAICIFGVGTTCPIDNDTAANILIPRVNGVTVGGLRIEHTFLFDTLRLGQSELKPGDNARRLERANAARSYMNGSNDCRDIETVWEPELSFDKSKRDFCELAQLMKARNVALLQLSLGRVQPSESGFAKQEIFMRLAMTEDGQAKLEKFLLSRDDQSFTVATGTLSFLWVVRKEGEAPLTAVEFQYEVVPNDWAYLEKGLARNTLAPERKIGKATFQKLSGQWQLIDSPSIRNPTE